MTDPMQKRTAAWLVAIGEPIRLAIVRFLATGEKSVTEVAEACKIPIVNASHHLKVMKDAGLVTVVPDGRFRRYHLIGEQVAAGQLTLTHESGVQVLIPLVEPAPKKWKK